MVKGFLRQQALNASVRARKRRAEVFWQQMQPTPDVRILDLGSEDGAHIAALVPYRDNVWLADIQPDLLAEGERRHGFKTLLIEEDGRVPVEDGFFDIVFCSSVIEHVTVPKAQVGAWTSSREFEQAALERQRRFAQEVRRISRGYFVQTPHRYFAVESHTWLPGLVVFLPRRLLLALIRFTNGWWIKRTEADFNLLTGRQMRELFPDAELVVERVAGWPKSLIAVRRG